MPLKPFSRRLVFVLMALVVSTPTLAHEIKAGDLEIRHPWVRATAKGVPFAAGYVKITNTGKTAETLLGATIDGAKAGEVHETLIDAKGIASMKMLSSGVPIPPGGSIQLKPEAMHIMFIGLESSNHDLLQLSDSS